MRTRGRLVHVSPSVLCFADDDYRDLVKVDFSKLQLVLVVPGYVLAMLR